jgi:hypothetical protein
MDVQRFAEADTASVGRVRFDIECGAAKPEERLPWRACFCHDKVGALQLNCCGVMRCAFIFTNFFLASCDGTVIPHTERWEGSNKKGNVSKPKRLPGALLFIAYAVQFTPPATGLYRIEVRDAQGLQALRSPLHVKCDLESGSVWGWGEGMLTQAGRPQLITSFPEMSAGHTVVDVSASSSHVLVLTSSGAVFSKGLLNQLGELGTGDNQPRPVLTRIALSKQVKAIATRDGASLLLDTHGTIYACGLRVKDQETDRRQKLKAPTDTHCNMPTTPPGLDHVRAASVYFVGDTALCLQEHTGQVGDPAPLFCERAFPVSISLQTLTKRKATLTLFLLDRCLNSVRLVARQRPSERVLPPSLLPQSP